MFNASWSEGTTSNNFSDSTMQQLKGLRKPIYDGTLPKTWNLVGRDRRWTQPLPAIDGHRGPCV